MRSGRYAATRRRTTSSRTGSLAVGVLKTVVPSIAIVRPLPVCHNWAERGMCLIVQFESCYAFTSWAYTERVKLSRRAFVGGLASLPLLAADEGWIPLFNGKDLDGWRASEHKDAWSVRDGQIVADGARSHLFYTGRDFKNFELEVEALTQTACNSGVYFHTAYQETGFPTKGFEVQINNTAGGEGTYRERKKTGSLYGLRNVYKQYIADGQWFKMHLLVRGKNVQVRLDNMLVVDYTEPTPPVIPRGAEKERFLDHGTFALQGHNPGSVARFRSVRVRPLPDDATAPGAVAPVVDATFRKLIEVGRSNYPVVDYHVHLKGGFTLEQAVAKSRRDGIGYGIAVECGKGSPVKNDAGARQFAQSMKGQPVFIAMQAEGREWTQMFSRQAAAVFAKDYDTLWTEERARKVLEAAARNQVAIEINNRYKLPGPALIKMAKTAGCKFTFGTNNTGPDDLGRCEYGLSMVRECRLG